MQYVIHAYDYTDEQALERRMAVRPHHFDGARALKETGNFIMGGALLDDRGIMIGSMMVVEFETDEALQRWLQQEPYVTGNVWERIDIKPFRRADI